MQNLFETWKYEYAQYMRILSIETSCDETAVSIVDVTGDLSQPDITVLSNLVLSQVKIHAEYGGVFPNLAKREHAKNLAPLLKQAFLEAGLATTRGKTLSAVQCEKIKTDLAREAALFEGLVDLFETQQKPNIDVIAVTSGPGLEPALWVGINAAKTLGEVWGIPVVPVNHMEGHIASVLLGVKHPVMFPALALLISGGHTELVELSKWLDHKIIGQTRDDAVGEAFDKVARMMDVPYPGGPKISAMATEMRESAKSESVFNFPRPMINSHDFDFSFSGLKTAVLYAIRDLKLDKLNDDVKKQIAWAFEDAIIETLVVKTRKAIEIHKPKTLIIAGGVIANKTLRQAFEKVAGEFDGLTLLIPTQELSTDNALMIALAAYVRYAGLDPAKIATISTSDIRAQGNLELSS